MNIDDIRACIATASAELSSRKEEINRLNVFPVPDGDTGTNMTMTIMAAAKEVAALEDPTMEVLAKAISSGSLRGARGNSGVILSQLFRGFTKGIKKYEEIDVAILAAAFQKAVETAYKAVMKPKEGTILTVAKGAADKALELAENDISLDDFLKQVIEEADAVLAKTPEMLPVLKEAGVVDSGGQGLVQVLKGAYDAFLGKEIDYTVEPAESTKKAPAQEKEAPAQAEIRFGYCTEFIIMLEKEYTPQTEQEFKGFLESIGDSIVVVSDEDVVKVHVHTNDPGKAISRALTYGSLTRIKIDNMRYQHRNAEEGKKADEAKIAEPENEYGFVAVCAGEGLQELFTDLGADVVVSGGQTMNPSTDNILNAINQTPAKTVFVLPNNKNIIMAAQQAVPLAKDRTVIVLQTKTIPQGISAMLSFDETQNAQANEEAMTEAAGAVETGQVTFAARDSEVDGKPIKQGQMMGMANGAIKFIGDDKEQIAFETAESMIDTSVHSLVTIIFGEGADENGAQAVEQKLGEKFGSDIEISIVDGGQPVYYYIISVE